MRRVHTQDTHIRFRVSIATSLSRGRVLGRKKLNQFRHIGAKVFRFHRRLSHWSFTSLRIARLAGKGAGNRRATALLQRSALFDGDWYLETYPDVAAGGLEPARHYLDFGWQEGRDPGPHFSTNAYLRANADVARAGTNPLIHFIEFGYSEGRGRTKHRVLVRRGPSPGEPFGEPAPCFSVAQVDHAPPRWRRAFRFEISDCLVVFEGLPIGYAKQADRRKQVEGAFSRLNQLSGNSPPKLDQFSDELTSELTLVDAWHIDQGRLRTRWRSSDLPIVVRAYQHNPRRGDRLAMVGEGLVSSSADFVDVALCNRHFPLLFIIAELDGEIRACRLLAFPSLCRGGLHYPELLAISRLEQSGEPRQLDPIGVGHVLADRLIAVRVGQRSPFLSNLVVDLVGADGAQPLFQSDFLRWLSQVARIEARASEVDPEDAAQRHLASADQTAGTCLRTADGASLVLAPDMIPTISALTATLDDECEPLQTRLSLLVAGSDPSQPAHLFEIPRETAGGMEGRKGYPRAWPLIVAGKTGVARTPLAASAIRLRSGRELSDSELLMPVSGPALTLRSDAQSVAWIFWPETWDQDLLAESLKALSLQDGAGGHEIVLISSHDPDILPVAKHLFGRVQISKTVADGLGNVEASLTGFVGSGTVLHDQRCSRFLSALFADSVVATASCVVVRSEPRGKGFQVTIADAGTAADGLPIEALDAKRMWRSAYPVVKPPLRFWMARTELFKQLAGASDFALPPDAINLSTSLVTVSTVGDGEGRELPVAPPAAPRASSIRSEMLFG